MPRLRAPVSRARFTPLALSSLACALSLTLGHFAWAAPTAPAKSSPAPAPAAAASSPAAATPPVLSSTMDGQLFYQLLIAEVQANRGDPGSAYQIYLEAARRHQDGQLYQRTVEIALRARAGEQALSAAKAWRQALPQSREAAEFNAQILIALGRTNELAAPLRALIQLTPAPQQPQLIASLPRSLMRIPDRQASARVIDEATQPWRQPPLELAEAWAASAEGWLMARQPDKAMVGTQKALALQPDLLTAQLIAADLIGTQPEAEPIVQARLQRPDASPVLRLGYARKLAGSQRFAEAATQLEQLVQQQPDQWGHWILLSAVRLEMRQTDAAEAALQPVLADAAKPDNAPGKDANRDKDLEQAYLLMAQVQDRRNKPAEALKWLDKADPRREKLGVQSQRARLLAAQGRIGEARSLLRNLPESEARDGVLKVQTEAQLLRELRQWSEAYRVLGDGVQRFPDDTDLIYDQAMVAEKLDKLDDMERLLRKVIQLAPDNANAYNALGYSLADRNVQLPEARKLIEQALALRPGDPYIVDSLGWVAFRQGQADEALKLLREAYTARPDTEIAAHLGEVLWQQGQKDEALRYWREGQSRDRDNDTLKGTLKRLGVSL